MTATKADYTKAAAILNKVLRKYDDGNFKPRVSVLNTENHGYGHGKYGLLLNDAAYDVVEQAGSAQDIFYAGETLVIGDSDYYLEPVTRWIFDLALL